MKLDKEQFDYFVRGFIQAMIFVNEEQLQMEYCLGRENISQETFKRIEKDCRKFINLADQWLDSGDLEQHGMDFFFVRNGHGVGFMDRKDYSREDAENLTRIAKSFKELYCYYENGFIGLEP